MADTSIVYRVSIKYWEFNEILDEIEVSKVTDYQYVDINGTRHSLSTDYHRVFKTKEEAVKFAKEFMEKKQTFVLNHLEQINKRLAQIKLLEEGLANNES